MLIATSVCAHTSVERRGQLPTVSGRLVSITDAGVEIVTEEGQRVRIPLELVRDLTGEGADDADFRSRQPLAEMIWRARTRLERQDFALAEPLFEQSFERTCHATHETALTVAEGLLRCRLHRGDHVRAVTAMLEVIRLRRSGVQTDAYASMPQILDEELWLCTALPPLWVVTRGLDRMIDDLGPWLDSADPFVAQLAALYRQAGINQQPARQDDQVGAGAGSGVRRARADTSPADLEAQRGLTLVQLCVTADTHRSDALPALRALSRDIAARPTERAWATLAAGRSMVQSSSAEERLLGSVLLLHLPAAHAQGFPYAAGLALAYARDARRAEGRDDEAAILDRELNARFPGHPARQRPTGLTVPTSVSQPAEGHTPGDPA